MADKVKVLVIGGPTATGKTKLSVELAKRCNGEIICADSMQVYRYLTVGTAKVTADEMQGVPHHLVDFLEPDVRFSVAEYTEKAHACIADIASRGKLPILVGGTGLYLQSVVEGIQFETQPFDPSVREMLKQRLATEGAQAMHEELCKIDPDYAKTVHPNNEGRVLRALELFAQTGKTMTQQRENSRPAERPYDDVFVALQYDTRELLYERIDLRVDLMMQQDLLGEAKQVYDHADTYTTAAQAIGYKEFFPYFTQEKPLEDCVAQLKQASRNYAKRQLTWFRRMEQLHWLSVQDPALADTIVSLLQSTLERDNI